MPSWSSALTRAALRAYPRASKTRSCCARCNRISASTSPCLRSSGCQLARIQPAKYSLSSRCLLSQGRPCFRVTRRSSPATSRTRSTASRTGRSMSAHRPRHESLKMGEIQALVLRAQAGGQPERPPIDLEIKIGSINRPLSVDHGLSFAYGREESKFIEAAEQRANQRRNDPMSTILGSVPFPGQVTKSDAEMRRRSRFRSSIPSGPTSGGPRCTRSTMTAPSRSRSSTPNSGTPKRCEQGTTRTRRTPRTFGIEPKNSTLKQGFPSPRRRTKVRKGSEPCRS